LLATTRAEKGTRVFERSDDHSLLVVGTGEVLAVGQRGRFGTAVVAEC
jgi:hypothetical protein